MSHPFCLDSISQSKSEYQTSFNLTIIFFQHRLPTMTKSLSINLIFNLLNVSLARSNDRSAKAKIKQVTGQKYSLF